MMSGPTALAGKRVLIIEDDYYQSYDEATHIARAGGTVVASTADADEACAMIGRERIDLALVDINLGQGPSFQTAKALRDRGIPFIFTTGYDAAVLPDDFQDEVLVLKPFSQNTLIAALALAADRPERSPPG